MPVRFGIDASGPGGSHTASQCVGADNKIAIGIDGFLRTHQYIPPTRVFVSGLIATGDMGRAGEGMNDEDGIVAFVV